MWNTNFFMITKCNFISGMIQYAYEESLRFSMHTRSHYDSVCIREVTTIQYAYEKSLGFSMHTRSHYDSVCIREVTTIQYAYEKSPKFVFRRSRVQISARRSYSIRFVAAFLIPFSNLTGQFIRFRHDSGLKHILSTPLLSPIVTVTV